MRAFGESAVYGSAEVYLSRNRARMVSSAMDGRSLGGQSRNFAAFGDVHLPDVYDAIASQKCIVTRGGDWT
jgi:hypothetical protein